MRPGIFVTAGLLLFTGCNSTEAATTTPPITKTVLDSHGDYHPGIDNDGIYLVGLGVVDIQMGKYRNFGGTNCYWARLRSANPNDIIESGRSSGPQVVEIHASDAAFQTQGCGTWQMTSVF